MALSHADGSYHFRNLRPGSYHLRAQSRDGYVLYGSEAPLEIRAAQSLTGHDFTVDRLEGTEVPSVNHVLSLVVGTADDKPSYLSLPPGVFNELDEATVEAWVRMKTAASHQSFFDYGHKSSKLTLKHETDGGLAAWTGDASGGKQHSVSAEGILPVAEWFHVAYVTGSGGVNVFLNGIKVGQDKAGNSFSGLTRGLNQKHHLGSPWNTVGDAGTHGQRVRRGAGVDRGSQRGPNPRDDVRPPQRE